MQDLDRGRKNLKALREMGEHIELDGSLVREIEGDARDEEILRAAIAMAQSLSLNIVAEGVEIAEQNEFLIREGCDIMQGYFHANPMPFADFITYLKRITWPVSCNRVHQATTRATSSAAMARNGCVTLAA